MPVSGGCNVVVNHVYLQDTFFAIEILSDDNQPVRMDESRKCNESWFIANSLSTSL